MNDALSPDFSSTILARRKKVILSSDLVISLPDPNDDILSPLPSGLLLACSKAPSSHVLSSTYWSPRPRASFSLSAPAVPSSISQRLVRLEPVESVLSLSGRARLVKRTVTPAKNRLPLPSPPFSSTSPAVRLVPRKRRLPQRVLLFLVQPAARWSGRASTRPSSPREGRTRRIPSPSDNDRERKLGCCSFLPSFGFRPRPGRGWTPWLLLKTSRIIVPKCPSPHRRCSTQEGRYRLSADCIVWTRLLAARLAIFFVSSSGRIRGGLDQGPREGEDRRAGARTGGVREREGAGQASSGEGESEGRGRLLPFGSQGSPLSFQRRISLESRRGTIKGTSRSEGILIFFAFCR
jgi:hypothetical protein